MWQFIFSSWEDQSGLMGCRSTVMTLLTRWGSLPLLQGHYGCLLLAFIRFLGVVSILVNSVRSDDASEFQNNLPAHVVWVVTGQDAELPCDVTPPTREDRVNMVLWFKDSIGIPLYSLDARGGDLDQANHWAISNDLGARTYFQTSGVSPARLRVHRVTLQDEGVFRCRVDFLNSPTKNFRVNLTIVVPPSEPIIYDDKGKEVAGIAGPFLEGYDLILSCHVIGGRPRPEVTWWRSGQLLDRDIESSTDSLTVNRLLLKGVSRSLLGSRLTCRARSSDLSPPHIREVPLDIYLKPRSVKIVTAENPLSAGKAHQLVCEASGSVPPARITWLLDGETFYREAATSVSETPNTTTSVLTFRPRAADDGKLLACRAENKRFPGGILEDRRRLDVAYPPIVSVQLEPSMDPGTLREGDTVRFLCEVRANPQPEPRDITWYQGEQLLEYNDTIGVLPAGRTLLLRGLMKESAGEYACAAANREGETRSGSVQMRVLFAPRCREGLSSRRIGAIRHETIDVRCEVEADPADDVRFSWTYNRTRDNVLPVAASRLLTSGVLSSVLRYKPESDQDYGTLACWASNSVGRQREPCLAHIVPATAPQPPHNCMLRNRTGGGLEVACMAGADGDLPQHFMLEVSEGAGALSPPPPSALDALNDEGIRPGPPLYRVFGAEPVFVLHSLEPGRDYELAVYAVNAKGRSDPPVLIPKVRVSSSMERLTGSGNEDMDPLTSSGRRQTPTTATVMLVGLVAAAGLILCGICLAATLVICRRRSNAEVEKQLSGRSPRPGPEPGHPNVYSEAPVPATSLEDVFVESLGASPPQHHQLRVRFRKDPVEIDDRDRTLYSRHPYGEVHSEGYVKRRSLHCEPDLIDSRPEVILSPTGSQSLPSRDVCCGVINEP